MPWERRFFKGDEVWVRTEEEGGELDLESGRVPMKFDRGESKVYHAHPGNISGADETAEEAWRRQLDEREQRLDERESELETREQKLEEREEALQEWEDQLKSGAIADLEARESTTGTSDTAAKAAGADGTNQTFGNISSSEIGPDAIITHISEDPPRDVAGVSGPIGDIVEIYTDGACSGNPGPCGFGFLVREDDDYREMGAFIGKGTNNIAELKAIEVALATLEDRDKPVRLYSDSQYAIGVLTKGWKARANRELILNIRDIIDEFDDLELRKVEGHAGEPLNERADDLAREAVDAHK